MPETLKSAGVLIKEGFQVMVYCSDDPIQAKRLEDIGCAAIMPLAAPIGFGPGGAESGRHPADRRTDQGAVIVDAGVARRRTPPSPWNWVATAS